MYEARDPRNKGVFPSPVMCKAAHWFHAMSLDIRLISDVQAIKVAKSVELGPRWVMTVGQRRGK